jgi:hypothetical protein
MVRVAGTPVALALLLARTAALAQPLPPLPAAGGSGLGDLLADPGRWATTVFNAALVGLGQQTLSDVSGFLGWMLGSGNLISQTPAALSYDSEVVGRLWHLMRGLANAALAVVTVWGGVNLLVRITAIPGR